MHARVCMEGLRYTRNTENNNRDLSIIHNEQKSNDGKDTNKKERERETSTM